METMEAARSEEDWVRIDAWGVVLSRRLCTVDVEIGDWLLAARDAGVHMRLGLGSFMEYVDRRLGLGAHAAGERMRVAEALTTLPEMRAKLQAGELSWSAVRELTRVAVQQTQREWLDIAEGKTAHDVASLVRGRRPGQTPRDPVNPRLCKYPLHFSVGAETHAMGREAMRTLRKRAGSALSDEEVLQEMFRLVLSGPRDDGRAPYQVALTRCENCGVGWQDAGGEKVPVPEEVMERAACDAQHIGSMEGHPTRATQSIPPAVRRMVVRRDGGRCKVAGCRNVIWLEVHHIQLRSEGGGHDPEQLVLLCGTHHRMLHEGLLRIDGTSVADIQFLHADGTAYGRTPDARQVSMMTYAYGTLREMGWGESEAKRVLGRVASQLGRNVSLGAMIGAALATLTDVPGPQSSVA